MNLNRRCEYSFMVLTLISYFSARLRFCNLAFLILCGSRKYPYPPHGGSRKFRGVGGSENDKFPKGRGVTQTGFFTGGLK